MEFSARLMRIAHDDAQIRLKRVVSMEAERFPKLAQRFYELGAKRALEELSRYFHEQIKRGRLIKEDTLLMSEHLFSLITSGPVRWKDLGIRCTYSSKDSKRRLQAAVKAFLRAYSRKRR